MKPLIQVILVCFLTPLMPHHLQAQTIIPGGDVSGTWEASGSPYEVMDNITIPDGETLIIEPGVLVAFQGYFSLNVQGQLLSQGEINDTITFTVNDTTGFHDPNMPDGGWNSIRFIDTPLENDSSIFQYCKFQFGKAVGDVWHLNAGGALCVIAFGKVRASHCLFSHNSAGGSYEEVPGGGAIHAAWSNIFLNDNVFTHNQARTGGAIQLHESMPVFHGNLFQYNLAETGGAVACGGPVELSFQEDEFISNTALSHGGGLMCWTANSAAFTGVVFSGNSAAWGGGLGMHGTPTTISQCSFENNLAQNIGGGMAADFCELTIENTNFINDSSAGISGGLHNWHCSSHITDCYFTGNTAALGGAVYSDFSTVIIQQSSFIENAANNGGALRFWCSSLATDEVQFNQNHGYNESGAIEFLADTNEYTEPYELSMVHTNFIENTAVNRFGAVWIQQVNSDTPLIQVTIDRCIFTENHAERIGAIQISGNTTGAMISNSIFTGNASTLFYACASFVGGVNGTAYNSLFTYNEAGTGTSGAVGIANISSFDFINCTFAGNTSLAGGAISMRRGSSSTLLNSIFWGNAPCQLVMNALTDTTPCTFKIYHCDVQEGQDSIRVLDTTVSVIDWGPGNIDAQPLFADILNDDFHLSDNSPCIGSGIDSLQIDGTWIYAPEYDMEENPRPDPVGSNPDMGVFESPMGNPIGIEEDLADELRSDLNVVPNPFTGCTGIEFTTSRSEMVKLAIYSVMGELLMVTPRVKLPAGKHNYTWEAGEFAPGIYYVILTAGQHRSIKKAMLAR